MEIKYIVRIKAEHNPPTFNKEMGSGVLITQIVDFKFATTEDLKSPLFQRQIFEQGETLKNNLIDVEFEIIK